MRSNVLRAAVVACVVCAICLTGLVLSPATARQGFDVTGRYGVELRQGSNASAVFVTDKKSGEAVSVFTGDGQGAFVAIYDGKASHPVIALSAQGLQVRSNYTQGLYLISIEKLAALGDPIAEKRTAKHSCPCGPDCQCENCECTVASKPALSSSSPTEWYPGAGVVYGERVIDLTSNRNRDGTYTPRCGIED